MEGFSGKPESTPDNGERDADEPTDEDEDDNGRGEWERERKAEKMECPKCGGKMKVRRNRATQDYFAGCSNFPECKGTREMDGTVGGGFKKSRPSPLRQAIEDDFGVGNIDDDDIPF